VEEKELAGDAGSSQSLEGHLKASQEGDPCANTQTGQSELRLPSGRFTDTDYPGLEEFESRSDEPST